MRTIATDVARSVVCLSVCVGHADLNPAKSAEPIEMPFGNRFMYIQGTVY